jgi:YVTN family beta-propeller protein
VIHPCRRGARLVALAVVLGACEREPLMYDDSGAGAGADGATGGSLGTGGNLGSGGRAGIGGNSGTGGRAGIGGNSGTGGRAGIGGAPGVGGRAAGGAGGGFISIAGALREIAIDPFDSHIYISNASQSQIEDYSLVTGSLRPAIRVGSKPWGFDITPDGSRLYVANSGQNDVSVVDVATGRELSRIPVPSNFAQDVPLSLAIAGNGKALLTTTFAGSGFGGRMLLIDLATQAVTLETDFYFMGSTTEATLVKASADRSAIAAVAGDISSGPAFVYRAAANAFGPENDLGTFVSNVAINRDGSSILVDGSYLLGATGSLRAVIGGRATGAVFAPVGPLAYRAANGVVEVVDTARLAVTRTLAVADSMQSPAGGSTVGRMVATSDGNLLAVITDHGLTLVSTR